MILDDKLNNGDLIILDGATGSELRNFGAELDPVVWCGAANLDYPDAVTGVHEAYIRAGADIITTNTFATCRHVLDGAGLGAQTIEINRRAAELAHQARDNAADGRTVAIAGSLSTMNAWVPGTITADPRYVPRDTQALTDNFSEQAQALQDAGVDFLILEMMANRESDLMLAHAAFETGLPVWVGLSASFSADRSLVPWSPRVEHPQETGGAQGPIDDLSAVMKAFADTHPQVMGIMHSTLPVTPPALAMLSEHWSGPVMAYPETIGTDAKGKRTGVSCTPDDFAERCAAMVTDGVQIIGGCCGTTIAHLKALAATLERSPH